MIAVNGNRGGSLYVRVWATCRPEGFPYAGAPAIGQLTSPEIACDRAVWGELRRDGEPPMPAENRSACDSRKLQDPLPGSDMGCLRRLHSGFTTARHASMDISHISRKSTQFHTMTKYGVRITKETAQKKQIWHIPFSHQSHFYFKTTI